MKHHLTFTLLLQLILALFIIYPTAAQEYSQRLNTGWEFHKGDMGGVWEAVREVKPGSPQAVPLWGKVSLPHCFNASDAVDPDVNYYQGPGWYRQSLEIKNPYSKGRTLLHFEGAGQKTQVYVYTTKVGEHTGGYDEWTVDITDAVHQFLKSEDAERFGGKVPVSIRCDNSRDLEMIPSDLSDFNVYGGIYRYLNLAYVPALSFRQAHINTSIDPKGKLGKGEIKASFCNYAGLTEGKIVYKIFDPSGREIISREKNITMMDGEINLGTFEIGKPRAWAPAHPQLYTLQASLNSSAGTHEIEERFGFRNFEFVSHGPFMLNGERLLIRGTHRHEDHAGVGAAMTEDLIRKEMIMIKEMGANFIRLGHYQQSRIVLDLCDSLGIMVWEEIPWCRGGLGNQGYKNQARQMLDNMISQHRNHPSVIIWGLGNENDWPGDFPDFEKTGIVSFMSELNDLAHKLDNSRETAIRRCEFCKDIVDVYSPSIWAGWYHGKFTDYKEVSEKNMEGVEHFFHAEWGASQQAGRHSEIAEVGLTHIGDMEGSEEAEENAVPEVTKDENWTVTYGVNLIDWHLKEQETMPWLTGAAYWAFKDFSTPVRPDNPVPYVNQKGLVERDLTKKESYYVFQSYWTDRPMAHIYGHTWPVRWGEVGEEKMIRVYSNCDKAELFVNGKSAGMQKRNSLDYPAAGLRWKVVLKTGENRIWVEAYKGKLKVTDSLTWIYQTNKWEAPAKLSFSKETTGENEQLVTVRVQDAAGVQCLDAKNWVRFDLIGDGKLLDNLGTVTGSRKVQLSNGRAGIKIGNITGKCILSVKCEGLETRFLEIDVDGTIGNR